MPSSEHEALVELFRLRPTLAWELAQASLPTLPVPRGPIQAVDRAFSDLHPPDYAADLVQDAGEGPLAVVEMQRSVDSHKPWRWPLYWVSLAQRHRRPVLVIVIALRERVARWARRGVDLGPCGHFRPLVVGPKELRLGIEAAADRIPELAVLDALVHARAPDAFARASRAIDKLQSLDTPHYSVYSDLILDALPRALRRSLESAMLTNYPYKTAFVRKFIAEGLDEGRRVGLQEGRQEGRQEGLEEGQTLATRTILAQVLRRRFPGEAGPIVHLIEAAPGSHLLAIADRLLLAPDAATARGLLASAG